MKTTAISIIKKTIIVVVAVIIVLVTFEFLSLFSKTNHFISQLDTKYESYGILNWEENKEVTKLGAFQVIPVGRLINVKLLYNASDWQYNLLEYILDARYSFNDKINGVYRCGAGTLMIDCRN